MNGAPGCRGLEGGQGVVFGPVGVEVVTVGVAALLAGDGGAVEGFQEESGDALWSFAGDFGEDFGDGGDGAEVGVEGDLFDEVWPVGLVGGFVVAGVAAWGFDGFRG
jgi:hypothetical protein